MREMTALRVFLLSSPPREECGGLLQWRRARHGQTGLDLGLGWIEASSRGGRGQLTWLGVEGEEEPLCLLGVEGAEEPLCLPGIEGVEKPLCLRRGGGWRRRADAAELGEVGDEVTGARRRRRQGRRARVSSCSGGRRSSSRALFPCMREDH